MAPRVSWSSLLPGLISLAVVIAIALGIMMFGGIGRIRGETMRLYVIASQVRGLIGGSAVWLAGQKIGVVEGVEFLPPGADTGNRVVIVLSVRASDTEQIRRDSRVEVRPGGNVIGPMVVNITVGTPASPRAADGDTLRATETSLASAREKLNAATEQLGPLMADARTVIASARNPDGTIGAARARGTVDVARVRTQVSRLRHRLVGSTGGPGPSTVMAQSRAALARVDSIRALLATTDGTYGRFRRDTTLGAAVASLRDELSDLRARIDTAGGTIHRIGADSAITRAVAAAQREMTLLFDDIRRRPLRYIAF